MAVKWKIPDLSGFAALIESLKKTKKASDAAPSGVSGLQEDVQGLADRTTAGFQQANTALQTLDSDKADKGHSHTAAQVGASPSGHKHTKSEITDFPSSMPASDVPAWAKNAVKPTYTADEVGARPSTWKPTAEDVGALPTTGGTLTGNLTGKYITGTWLQTTGTARLTTAATRIPVLDTAGWIYFRNAEELLADIGGASKPLKGSLTIPASGWSSDSTVGYTKYVDITVSGVTANDRADIIIAPGSVQAAADCGLCPVSETMAGKVRIRAAKVPTSAISAEYWIERT